MFEHYTFGMQAQPLPRRSREPSPGGSAAATAGGGHAEQSQCPSPPLSATALSPSITGTGTRRGSVFSKAAAAAPDSIDHLAQELSKQNLQLDRANLEQLQRQLSSPASSPRRIPPSMSPVPPCPELEIDDAPRQQPVGGGLSRQHRPPALLPPCAMDVDRIDRTSSSPVPPDAKRLVRQRSSHFNNSNPSSNSRAIQDLLVQGMIASGSQCTVHSSHRPSPPPPPRTPTSATSRPPLGPILEPDDDDCMDLQVDEAYLNGGGSTSETEREERFLIEAMMSLRRAGGPAGVRKFVSAAGPGGGGLGGALQLHYRASAEAALNCANVVRSRPRMRKRAKMHHHRHHDHNQHRGGSRASSIVSSAFSSPVIPPSLPDDLQHVPPYRV